MLAQVVHTFTFDFKHILIFLGVLAVFYVVVVYGLKLPIPQWVWWIIGICCAVFFGIIAIEFLESL